MGSASSLAPALGRDDLLRSSLGDEIAVVQAKLSFDGDQLFRLRDHPRLDEERFAARGKKED